MWHEILRSFAAAFVEKSQATLHQHDLHLAIK